MSTQKVDIFGHFHFEYYVLCDDRPRLIAKRRYSLSNYACCGVQLQEHLSGKGLDLGMVVYACRVDHVGVAAPALVLQEDLVSKDGLLRVEKMFVEGEMRPQHLHKAVGDPHLKFPDMSQS